MDNLLICPPVHGYADEFIRESDDRGILAWPALDELAMSADDRDARCSYVGGSDANAILSNNAKRIYELWREKRRELEPVNLADRLPVMLGSWTEPFNRQWFERITGQRLARVGVAVTCSEHGWRRCTLDGFIEETATVFEAKHTNAFSSAADVLNVICLSCSTTWR